MMHDPYNELNQMLVHMPNYTSWTTDELEELFIRFRAIVIEMVQSPDYTHFRWLGDHCPDLGKRINELLLEKEVDKQGRYFNNIAFELKCAIEVLIGKIEVNNHEEWVQMLERVTSPNDFPVARLSNENNLSTANEI